MEEREIVIGRQRFKRGGGPNAGKRPFIEKNVSGTGDYNRISQHAFGVYRKPYYSVSLPPFGKRLRRV